LDEYAFAFAFDLSPSLPQPANMGFHADHVALAETGVLTVDWMFRHRRIPHRVIVEVTVEAEFLECEALFFRERRQLICEAEQAFVMAIHNG